MPLIIDGHNLLYSIQKASEGFESVTDLQLCGIVGRYLRQVGEKGEIIFDGAGPRDKSSFENMGDLQVSFAGLGTDTDTVIEEKIRVSTAPKRLTIVSSDRRLRKAARTRKATAVRSDVFWNDIQKRLSQRERVKEPPEKRLGLSESETKQWLDFFGLEQ